MSASKPQRTAGNKGGTPAAAGKLPKVRLRLTQEGRIRVDVQKKRHRKPDPRVFLMSVEYKDWPTMPEVCAILQRVPKSIRAYQRRGLLRTVMVHEGDPRRHYLRLHPQDVRDLGEVLRAKDFERVAVVRKKRAVEKLVRLPGPGFFDDLRKKRL